MLMNTFKVPEHLAHMVKSAYKAADGTYMIDLNVGYRSEYGTNWVQADTKKQAIYELENFVYEVDKDAWMEEFSDSANTLYEESIQELRNKIIRLKGQRYLDGIDKRSNGHAGYYALSKILHNLEQKQKENSVKSGENNKNNVQLQFDFKENYKITRTDKQYLVEATMKQLKNKTLSEDPTRAKKSKNVQSRYLGISKYGVLNFETSSETHAGVKWYQEIHFPSFDGFMNIVEGGDKIEPDDVKRVMMSDNLKVSCFTEETEVQTSDGIKKIKDIKVGDKVLTHTGKYQEVLQTFENDYSGKLIEINGVKSTPNHPYLVKLPDGSVEWKMACEITEDMKLLEVKNETN